MILLARTNYLLNNVLLNINCPEMQYTANNISVKAKNTCQNINYLTVTLRVVGIGR